MENFSLNFLEALTYTWIIVIALFVVYVPIKLYRFRNDKDLWGVK